MQQTSANRPKLAAHRLRSLSSASFSSLLPLVGDAPMLGLGSPGCEAARRRRARVTAINAFGMKAMGTETMVTVSWMSIAWAR
ncbi:MAG: hypothetical protein ACT4PO_09515 [Actinomycetota bacterium]